MSKHPFRKGGDFLDDEEYEGRFLARHGSESADASEQELIDEDFLEEPAGDVPDDNLLDSEYLSEEAAPSSEREYSDDGEYLPEEDYSESGESFPEEDYPEDREYFPEEDYPESKELLPEDGYTEEEFLPEENYPESEAYLQEEELSKGELSDDSDSPYQGSLEMPELGEELSGDDNAMYGAGLRHPEDEIFRDSGEEYTPSESAEVGEENSPKRSRRQRPPRKGRPRRRKGAGLLSIPQLASAAIWLLLIVAIGVSLGRGIWLCAADVLAFGRESKEVTISVTGDDTMETIAQKLQNAGLIRYKQLFLLYADLSNAEEKITTGTFTLNTLYDYNALVKQMSPRSGNRAVVEDVLIPEGYSCRQIFERLEANGVCTVEELEEYAASGELGDYWFLEDVTRGDKYCLEGYLFPATYDFYENSTPKQVLTKMLDAFEANFTEELSSQLPALNERISQMMRDDGKSEEYIAENQITLHQLVTVASLIEKETAGSAESPVIASVIYNRLFRWGDTPRYLNIDATIIYALDGKTDLTAEDMAVDSPYNTYTNTGLTPGPISNPGIASLTAALNPTDTDYYYYVLNPETGTHEFTSTYEEHQALVQKFQSSSADE